MVRGGTTYSKLVTDLKTNYDVEISEKYLQQILHENNIFMSETDAIRELNKPGDTSVGYRAMTVRICQAYKINVSRQDVSNSQERVDPEGKPGIYIKIRTYNDEIVHFAYLNYYNAYHQE